MSKRKRERERERERENVRKGEIISVCPSATL
jgi:hypothetical protein